MAVIHSLSVFLMWFSAMPRQQRPDLVVGILVALVFIGIGPVLSLRMQELTISDVARGLDDCTVGKFTTLCRLKAICESLESEAKPECTDTFSELKERITYMDKAVRAIPKDPELLKEEYFVFDEEQYASPAEAFNYCIKEGNRALRQVQTSMTLKFMLDEDEFNEEELATKIQEVQEVSKDAKLTDVLDECTEKIPLLSAPLGESKSERQRLALLLEGIYERLLITYGAFTQRARDTSFAKNQVTARLEQQLAVGNLFLRWLSSFFPDQKDPKAIRTSLHWSPEEASERRKGLLRAAVGDSEMHDLMLERLSKSDVWFNLQLLRYEPDRFMKQHQADFIKYSVAKLKGPEIRALVAHFGYRDRSPHLMVLQPPGTPDGVKIKQAFLNNLWAAFDALTGLNDDPFFQYLASLASDQHGASEPAPKEATLLPPEYARGLSDSCVDAVGSRWVLEGRGWKAKWVLQSPENDAASFASSLERFLLMDPDAESDLNGCLLWGSYGIGPYTNGPALPIKEKIIEPKEKRIPEKKKAKKSQLGNAGLMDALKNKKPLKKRPNFLKDLHSATKKKPNPLGGDTDLVTELQFVHRKGTMTDLFAE